MFNVEAREATVTKIVPLSVKAGDSGDMVISTRVGIEFQSVTREEINTLPHGKEIMLAALEESERLVGVEGANSTGIAIKRAWSTGDYSFKIFDGQVDMFDVLGQHADEISKIASEFASELFDEDLVTGELSSAVQSKLESLIEDNQWIGVRPHNRTVDSTFSVVLTPKYKVVEGKAAILWEAEGDLSERDFLALMAMKDSNHVTLALSKNEPQGDFLDVLDTASAEPSSELMLAALFSGEDLIEYDFGMVSKASVKQLASVSRSEGVNSVKFEINGFDCRIQHHPGGDDLFEEGYWIGVCGFGVYEAFHSDSVESLERFIVTDDSLSARWMEKNGHTSVVPIRSVSTFG